MFNLKGYDLTKLSRLTGSTSVIQTANTLPMQNIIYRQKIRYSHSSASYRSKSINIISPSPLLV